MKTLYLNEDPNMHVRLDGPSLWIQKQGSSGSRVPFRRIDRVVISGAADLGVPALCRLLEEGIPIQFLRRNGKSLGFLSPEKRITLTWFCSLRDVPFALERAKNYLAHQRRGRLIRCLKTHLPLRAGEFESGPWLGDLRAAFTQCEEFANGARALSIVFNHAHGLMAGLIHKVLLEQELDPHRGLIVESNQYGLVTDFHGVLEPDTWNFSIWMIKKNSWADLFAEQPAKENLLSPKGRQAITVRFEMKKKKYVFFIKKMILDLLHLSREIGL